MNISDAQINDLLQEEISALVLESNDFRLFQEGEITEAEFLKRLGRKVGKGLAGAALAGALATGAPDMAQAAQKPTAPLVVSGDFDRFNLIDLFLNVEKSKTGADRVLGLSRIGQKELDSLNQTDESGKLTDRAELERATLFQNPKDAPLQLSADDLASAIMEPKKP
jgi:hypothetical protein